MTLDLGGQRVLVTGAAGFIGSHLVERLLSAGARVRAFVHYNSSNSIGHLQDIRQGQIEIYKGDLRDPHAVLNAHQNIDTVFHLGALIAIPYSYQCPTDVVHTNALGTLNVAQAALACGIKRVIHTSTSEVYGTAHYVPMDERHPLQGQSPYSASKIAADKIMESFHRAYGLPVVTVRPFNAYGPRQSQRAVIATIIQQALYASEIQLGNLHATRDFTFVEDTAFGFMLAAQSDAAIGSVFNLGSGYEISIIDLAAKILQVVGRDIPVCSTTERLRPEKSEVDRLCSDSAWARQTIGWNPQVTLDEGLVRTVAWMAQGNASARSSDYVL